MEIGQMVLTRELYRKRRGMATMSMTEQVAALMPVRSVMRPAAMPPRMPP